MYLYFFSSFLKCTPTVQWAKTLKKLKTLLFQNLNLRILLFLVCDESLIKNSLLKIVPPEDDGTPHFFKRVVEKTLL